MINAGFLLILILYNGEKIHTIFLKVKVKNFYYKFWKNEKYFKYHFLVFSSGDTGPKVEILLIIQRQLPPQNLNIQKDNSIAFGHIDPVARLESFRALKP